MKKVKVKFALENTMKIQTGIKRYSAWLGAKKYSAYDKKEKVEWICHIFYELSSETRYSGKEI